MKSGEIGHSAFRCDQHVIGIDFNRSAYGPALELDGARICQILASRPFGDKKKEFN